MQFMTFLAVQPPHADAFADWCLNDLAPRVLRQPGVECLSVNLAVSPPGLKLYGTSQSARL